MKLKYNVLDSAYRITQDNSRSVVLNGCVAVEHLGEVIKILEECDAKLKNTAYYQAVRGAKGIHNTDTVLKTKFEIDSSVSFLKLILAQIEEK